MGIPALWPVLKDQDHSVPIAQLAEDHFKRHGRPLRIAIDEADWRFHNLTATQVFVIRAKSNQPAFQGIEKAMFYRICRFLALNIQLLFVFDGPRRPAKRGRNGGVKIDYEQRRLLKELLQHFRIPCHEAPGEAEAECARLQVLKVVDAVWSQDSDSLMFGCDLLIRDDRIASSKNTNDRSKENTKKSATSVRVVRGQEIWDVHKLDRDALVLFAMLAGGDYDTAGLRQCGAATALRIAQTGLGKSLCRCRTQNDCSAWRESLVAAFQQISRNGSIQVPPNFPDIKILNKYNRPTVSTDEQLLNLRGLRKGWDEPIDEFKLLEVTSSRFNIWGRLYMNWVGPVLLTKYLVSRDPSLAPENIHQIKVIHTRGKQKEGQVAGTPLERKITFSPFGLTTLEQKDFEGSRAGYWTSAADEPFEPGHRVQWEFPHYLLYRALTPDMLDPATEPSPAPRRKRKHDHDAMSGADRSSVSKKRRCPSDVQADSHQPIDLHPPTNVVNEFSPYTTKSHNDSSKSPAKTTTSQNVVNLISDDEDSDLKDPLPNILDSHARQVVSVHTPPINNHVAPQTLRSGISSIVDLGPGDEDLEDDDDDDDDDNDDFDLRHAIWLSLKTPTRTPAPSAISNERNITSHFDVDGGAAGHMNRVLNFPDNRASVPLQQTSSIIDALEVNTIRDKRRRHFEQPIGTTSERIPASPAPPTAKHPMIAEDGIDFIDLT